MIRGTTPDYVLTIAGHDLADATIFVTLSQGVERITKTGSDLNVATDETGSSIAFSLTQQETLRLSVGKADIQVRFIDANGDARATEIAKVTVGRVLKEGVIEYAGSSS